MSISFSSAEIESQRRLNRVLAWLPRLSVIGRIRRGFVRAVLWAATLGADRKLRSAGLRVDHVYAGGAGGLTSVRTIQALGAPAGIVLDFHGGAWAFGSSKGDDLQNGTLALAGALVLAPDYRHALPRSIEAVQAECAAVLEWLLTRAPEAWATLPIVIAGESAGAHLALGAAMTVRDRGIDLRRVRGLLLHCGAYDLGGSPSALAAASDALVLHGPTLSEQMHLLTGRDASARRDPALSPLYGDLGNLPRSLLLVGDIDPLLDDSLLLAEALRRAGSHVEVVVLPQAPHAVIHLPGPYAERVRAAAAAWVAAHFERAQA